MATAKTEQSYRVLWAQVVLQAKADLEHEPIDSILFNQAAAFFVSRGEWAESRAIVADCLEMHPDELYRCGERWIADRRRRDGFPPAPPPSQPAQKPGPLPRLVAIPGPDTFPQEIAPRAHAAPGDTCGRSGLDQAGPDDRASQSPPVTRRPLKGTTMHVYQDNPLIVPSDVPALRTTRNWLNQQHAAFQQVLAVWKARRERGKEVRALYALNDRETRGLTAWVASCGE